MTDRCRSCHWWTANRPPFDTGWGTCELLSADSLTAPANALGCDPGEGYLVTRADFGCVAWEPLGHPAAMVGEGVPT